MSRAETGCIFSYAPKWAIAGSVGVIKSALIGWIQFAPIGFARIIIAGIHKLSDIVRTLIDDFYKYICTSIVL